MLFLVSDVTTMKEGVSMNWAENLQNNLTTAEQLKGVLQLNDKETEKLKQILEQFPMSITQYYLSLIHWEDENDPIKKMCIPSIRETDLDGSFDTSGEADNTVVEGMQHKYKQSAMILSTNRCAMYCRHCFRKRLVGLSDKEIAKYFDKIMEYIEGHTEISNVLISGGDAFLNSNEVIEKYLERLCRMEHIDFIRFGTRTPVVLPMRITEDKELLDILQRYSSKKQIYVITHFNHPNEITRESKAAVQALLHVGIPVRNQAVLLKGINDSPQVLGTLLKRLTAAGVLPYYVFQCRPVSGVKNQFQVPLKQGFKIVEEAKNMQNGMGKNFRYVLSHEAGKIEILGMTAEDEMLFKYHQAKKPEDAGRLFIRHLEDTQCWL
ncbi:MULTISPECIES: KamA family radical SAM protein [Lactonifactor]|uniref:KamA family radical SAM protein n=1 Tax=Lactonifactor TaxID=420345 RepID=UPI00325C1895